MGVSGPWPRRTQDGSCYAGLVRQPHATSVAPQAMTVSLRALEQVPLNLQRRKCILAMAGSVATKPLRRITLFKTEKCLVPGPRQKGMETYDLRLYSQSAQCNPRFRHIHTVRNSNRTNNRKLHNKRNMTILQPEIVTASRNHTPEPHRQRGPSPWVTWPRPATSSAVWWQLSTKHRETATFAAPYAFSSSLVEVDTREKSRAGPSR